MIPPPRLPLGRNFAYQLSLLLITSLMMACEPSPRPPASPPTPPPPHSPLRGDHAQADPPAPQPSADAVAAEPAAILPPPTADPGPTEAPAADSPQEIYPGIWLNRQDRWVELAGSVIGQRFDWLELLACRGDIRAHESILRIDADARQVHLALLLLGLEPGSPASAQRVDGEVQVVAPTGPEVELFMVVDGQADPVPANRWVVDQETGEEMPGNRWLFTGSKIVEHQGQAFFLAEENGTLVSLVNFGDELLSRPTDRSQDGGNDLWTANTPLIPPAGTAVRLRIVPAG